MTATLASVVWERARFATRGALAALALSACGQAADGGQSTASTDTASAYLALSTSVQSCMDERGSCVTAAAGDAAQVAACDTAAQSCLGKTQGAQDQARQHLRADAEGCVRQCRHHSDSDGGVDEGTMQSTRGCMRGHSPVDGGACMDTFFSCLDATGVRQSGAQTELDTATRDAIAACVESAHTCLMNQMMAGHHGHAAGPRGWHDAAGHPAFPAAAGHPAFPPFGHAHDAAGARARPMRGPFGAAGAAPEHHRWMGAGGAGGN